MTTDLCTLIYNSAATQPMNEADLVALLEHARNHNAAIDVTGMLLYHDHCFFQVLEGPRDDVHALADRIEQDPRHTQMTVIIDEPIHKRSFGEWTMGFAHVSPDDLRRIDGMNDFFDGQRVLTDVDAGRAKKLLSAFGQGRWRVRLANHRPSFAPIETDALTPQRPAFATAFQPIVDAQERSVFAYQALLDGVDGESGAEVMQRVAIDEIDEFDGDARRMALGAAMRLGLQHPLHMQFVPRTLGGAKSHLAATIATAEQCGIDPQRMIFEIQHEVSVINPVEAAAMLENVRRQGVRISIGEFGSGYAGLALLEHYRPDMISIDEGLTRNVHEHGPRQAIVRGVLQTCEDLGIDVIATDVSSMDDYAWMIAEGIHLFTGDLIARPSTDQLPTPSLPLT